MDDRRELVKCIERIERIEMILSVFRDYWSTHACIDIVFSKKFGYLYIDLYGGAPEEQFIITKIKDENQLLYRFIEQMEADFMLEKGEDCWIMSAEYVSEFMLRVQTYLDKLPWALQFQINIKQ